MYSNYQSNFKYIARKITRIQYMLRPSFNAWPKCEWSFEKCPCAETPALLEAFWVCTCHRLANGNGEKQMREIMGKQLGQMKKNYPNTSKHNGSQILRREFGLATTTQSHQHTKKTNQLQQNWNWLYNFRVNFSPLCASAYSRNVSCCQVRRMNDKQAKALLWMQRATQIMWPD